MYPYIYPATSSYIRVLPMAPIAPVSPIARIVPIVVPPFSSMHAHVAPSRSNPSPAHIANPQANLAYVSPVVQDDTSWFPDSGSINHLTNATP